MRFWFVHSTDVPLREQIVHQISLGILSGELAPGERLPSIRELARRFAIHANTVSAAYRKLHYEHLVTYRRGSGVYVNADLGSDLRIARTAAPDEALVISQIFDRAVAIARQLNLSDGQLLDLLTRSLLLSTRRLLVESDPDLARLVLFEIEAAGRMPPELCLLAVDSFSTQLRDETAGWMPVVLPSKAAAARAVLGDSAPLIVLQISPVALSMAKYLPRSREHLVAVASHWPKFLDMARTMLISSGFAPEALICRDARLRGWAAGLDQAAAIVCDKLTATKLSNVENAIVFPLLSPPALEQFPAVPANR